jgi:hypothetical protein
MNAATTTTTASNRSTNLNGLRRVLQTLRTELRRALELAGAPYKDGILPPL